MLTSGLELFFSWLLTYSFHSTILLLIIWGLNRFWSSYAVKELLWRVGLVGGVITASLSVFGGLGSVFGKWTMFTNHPIENIDILALSMKEGYTTVSNGTLEISLTSLLIVLFISWLIGAFFALKRLAHNYQSIDKQLNTRSALHSSTLKEKLTVLCQKAGIRRKIRISTSSNISCPLALGIGEVCIPPFVLTNLNEEEQTSVLAHELAHLVRLDNLWRRFAAVLQALFFFNPLYRLAFRELNIIAEYQCDTWAVKQTSSSLPLAKSLAKVANSIIQPPSPLMSTMAQDKRGLSDRVAHILNNPTQNRKSIEKGIGMALLLLGVTLLFVPSFGNSSYGYMQIGRDSEQFARDREIRQLEIESDNQLREIEIARLNKESETNREIDRLNTERDRQIRQLEIEFDRRIRELEVARQTVERERMKEIDRLSVQRDTEIRDFEENRN